jgi:hypothetical protein
MCCVVQHSVLPTPQHSVFMLCACMAPPCLPICCLLQGVTCVWWPVLYGAAPIHVCPPCVAVPLRPSLVLLQAGGVLLLSLACTLLRQSGYSSVVVAAVRPRSLRRVVSIACMHPCCCYSVDVAANSSSPLGVLHYPRCAALS